MLRPNLRWLVVPMLVSAALAANSMRPPSGHTHSDVADRQVRALKQAILDEIYADGYQTEYRNLETAPGKARIPIYVSPRLSRGVGHVIYKLMPFGRVDRVFQVGKHGLVVLWSDPHNGFPPNGGTSMRTVFLSDQFVLKAMGTWKKHHVTVLFHPPKRMIQEAKKRQKKRYGAYLMYPN